MILIIGGIFQGKDKFARTLVDGEVCKAVDNQDDFYDYDVILNIDELVGKLLKNNISIYDGILNHLDDLKNKVITGNEIGLGIVPVEKENRILRDEVGRLYQELAKHAKKVYRMWNGIPILLKGDTNEN